MTRKRPTSFWRYSLNVELLAAGLAFLVLALGGWFTLRELEKRYVELFRADAEKMNLYLREHLAAGVDQLEHLASLRPDQSAASLQLALQPFSDLYLIDSSQQIQRVLKAVPGSRVFQGFSFSQSKIGPYLRTGVFDDRDPPTSVITRGLEDELASIYVQRPISSAANVSSGRLWLLGRLNLGYIQAFLKQFSRFAGTPVLLVSDDGFVMLSGTEMPIPAIDLNFATATGGVLRPVRFGGREWLPVVAADSGLGARVVTLVPLGLLRQQQQTVLWAAIAGLALMALVFVVKNLSIRRRLFLPVSQFVRQLNHLEVHYRKPGLQRESLLDRPLSGGPSFAGSSAAGSPTAGPSAAESLSDRLFAAEPARVDPSLAVLPSVIDFQEVQHIRSSFDSLMAVIAQRDQILQHQLRTSLTASAIAHEINIPLGSLLLLCDQARRELDAEVGELDAAALVATLHQQSLELSRVVERMRMLLRNVQTSLRPIRLSDVVISSCAYVRHLLREHEVELACEGLDADDTLVLGDAGQLKAAATNLLRNAIEAVASCSPGQRRIAVALEQAHPAESASPQAGTVAVVVADSGPGFAFIPSDDTLFQSTKACGSGLGLFVVRTAMANHNGRVAIARSLGLGGAEVRLIFPVCAPTS
jgi:signal transduction histidine kinase